MSQTLRLSSPIASCVLLAMMLTGCSHSNTKSAPIGSVENASQANKTLTGQKSWLTPPTIVYQRNYQQIAKGSYSNKTYQVKHGDTLFYIAWITGNDYRELAQRNGIAPPYALAVGQTLKVGEDISKNGQDIHHVTQNSQIATKKLASQTNNAYPYNPGNKGTAAQSKPSANAAANSSASQAALVWRWPAQGKIIDGFSSSAQGNKGIDIAGSKGEAIRAAAAGRVVYAGNALRGYGNLIIIKHDDDYLSAYAHNDAILVKEQQQIQAGQQIATMGNTGSNSVRLHFEIRYKGKSVNPLQYLPQR